MSTLENIGFFLAEKVSVFLHALATSWFSAVVSALCLLGVWLVSKGLRNRIEAKICLKVGLPKGKMSFGPAYAWAAKIMLYMACIHIAFWAVGVFAVGPDRYGLQGEFLTRFSLDELAPVPYMVGFPAAIVFYGSIFLFFFRARMELDYKLGLPPVIWIRALLTVPLLPFAYTTQLLWSIVMWVVHKLTGKGDAKPAPPATTVGRPTIDGRPEWALRLGFERRQLVTVADGKTVLPDGSKLPHVYRLLPRFQRAMGPTVAAVALAVVIACFVPILACPSRLGVDLPDPETVEAYEFALSPGGGGPASDKKAESSASALSVQPFEVSVPREDGSVGKPLPRPKIDPENETGVGYVCDGKDKAALRAALAALQDAPATPEIRARILLNYHVCDTFLDPLSSAKDAVWDLVSFSRESDEPRSNTLDDVRKAAGILAGTSDWGRGYLFAAIIHWENHRVWQAAELLRTGLEVGLEKSTRRGGAESGGRAFQMEAFLPVMALANGLVRLNRFKESDKVVSEYVELVEDWVRAKGGEAKPRLAFLALVKMHEALYLARTFEPRSADRKLDSLRKILEREEAPEPLVARCRVLSGRLEKEYITARPVAELAIFGPLPAGVMAALMLFALGMFLAMKTPLSARERKERKAEDDEELRSARLAPDVSEILAKLRKPGEFFVGPGLLRRARRGVRTVARDGDGDDSDGGDSKNAAVAEIDKAIEETKAKAAPNGAADTVAPEVDSPWSLSERDRPIIAFVRELLRDQGRFGDAAGERLYAHQEAALMRIDEMRKETARSADSGTVMLVSAASSGRSTAALVASMEAIIELGHTVLYVCANESHMRKRAGFFNKVRAMEGWSWNLNAMVGGDDDGVEGAVTRGLPIHLLFGTPEIVHRFLLPQQQQHRLYGFLRNLGLIVIEDLHRFRPAALAHSSFIFRRLNEILTSLGRSAVSLVTSAPVMANEEDFVRNLLGPVAGDVTLVPEEADDAPNPSSHDIYVLQQADPSQPAFPECSPPHVAGAIVQAAGTVREPGVVGTPPETGTWPTSLVGFENRVADREDRVLKIYGEMGVGQASELHPLHSSRASVFPLTADKVSELESRTRHGGISARSADWETEGHLAGGGKWAERRDPALSEGSGPHTTFLMTGPEPVDRFLADRVDRYALYAGLSEETERFAGVFYELRPLWTIPRRNRRMNRYHLYTALRERPSPGQSLDFLDDVFETDLLHELLDEGQRKQLIGQQVVPLLYRDRLKLKPEPHYWSPRDQSSVEDLYLDNYVSQLVWIIDRVSHRKLFRFEKCRVRTVFYPGRVFVSNGVRMQIRAPEHQDGFERDEWFAEPIQHLPLRTARIRVVSVKPGPDEMEVRDHSFGSIDHELQKFKVAYGRVEYREEVKGRRLYGVANCTVGGQEHCLPQTDSYSTEMVAFGFAADLFDGFDENPDRVRAVLHGATLLLRQCLPLVLNCSSDDVEVIFGVGAGGEEGAGHSRGLEFVGRNRGDSETVEERGPMPFIALVDRMADGLGYARAAYDNLFQGKLVKDWARTALRLALWASKHPGRTSAGVFQTSHYVEEEDNCWNAFEAVDGATSNGEESRENDESVQPEEVESGSDAHGAEAEPGEPEQEIEAAVLLLNEVITFLRRIVALSEEQAEKLHKEDWLEQIRDGVVSEPLGVEARRGVLDPLGMEPAEDALAAWLLPEWPRDADSPWSVAFLCALKAGTDDPVARGGAERLAMAFLAVHSRDTGDDGWAPPVGRRQLSRYRLPLDSTMKLDDVPALGSPSGDGTVLGLTYARLARSMGFFDETGVLTERGCALARSLLTHSLFRETFDYLVDLTRPAGEGEARAAGDIAEGLRRRDLPAAARRVLADGLSQVQSVKDLGPAWVESLRGHYQPRRVDGQLKWVTEVLVPGPGVTAKALDRFEVLRSVHSFDRACRTLVAALRAKLSSYVRLDLRVLAWELRNTEATSEKTENKKVDYVTPVGLAAEAVLASEDARKLLPADTVAFIRQAAKMPMRASGKSEDVAADMCAQHILKVVVRRLAAVSGAEAALKLVGPAVQLEPGWDKKNPVDNSRGLLFRLDCLGNFFSETLWSIGVAPLGLSSDPAPQCDINWKLPKEFDEPLEPPMPVGEIEEPVQEPEEPASEAPQSEADETTAEVSEEDRGGTDEETLEEKQGATATPPEAESPPEILEVEDQAPESGEEFFDGGNQEGEEEGVITSGFEESDAVTEPPPLPDEPEPSDKQ